MCGERLSVQFLKYGKAAGFPLFSEREVLEKVVKCAPDRTRTDTGRIYKLESPNWPDVVGVVLTGDELGACAGLEVLGPCREPKALRR